MRCQAIPVLRERKNIYNDASAETVAGKALQQVM
jgi:hypothetical protein